MNSVLLELLVGEFLRLWGYNLVSFVDVIETGYINNIRLFLFQTALGSGPPGTLPPFTPGENLGTESFAPMPSLATSLGRELNKPKEAGGGVLELPTGRSAVLDGVTVVFALAARKVLLTDTALKVAGFFTDESVRECPRSPSRWRVPSVSEPPLTLTSAE